MANPKEYTIHSRSYGITANEAADTLLTHREIRKNTPLLKAALANLKQRKAAIDAAVKQ